MSKGAWWHLYKLALAAGLIAVLRIHGWESSLLHIWFYFMLALTIVAHVLGMVVLSQRTHEHRGTCDVCLKKAIAWKP
jgi:hypothetical protein